MKGYIYAFLILIVFTLYQCTGYKKVSGSANVTQNVPVDFNVSPVVPADQTIARMKVEDGFEVKLVAAEPLVSTPVAMSFDAKGRMWVVEMSGYMPDSVGRGEDLPSGKIVILDDKNGDGVADQRTVFLDSLVLPRSICLIDSGILVAEPPRLWFYDIRNGKPVNKTLVDAKYADAGNVEHQPNGLLRAMDNWIYNAKSSKRYRRQNGKWLIEDTHFRGQWGISQDDNGRLYYNDNSANIYSDYFTPGFGATNPNQRDVKGFSERTVADNRVYPIRPTPGVNRGYSPGTLDDSLRLRNFTAACSPLVYRGALFGDAFRFNAFVAEPSANLIKRDVLKDNGLVVSGTQAYQGKEFLASVDERFRPVSLYDGPDGALYVLDMYRGIIQHKTYVTAYLREQFAKRDLSAPLNCGRIYKVVPKGAKTLSVVFPEDVRGLVTLLGDKNGFVRDKAQQILIDKRDASAVPYLKQAIKDFSNELKVVHAMWTLEGLHALQTDEVIALLKQPRWTVQMQALSVVPSVMNGTSYLAYVPVLKELLGSATEQQAPYLAFIANYLKPYQETAATELLTALAVKYPNNVFLADAVIAAVPYKEEGFMKLIAGALPDTSLKINKQLGRVVADYKSKQKNSDPKALAKLYPKGAALFASTCQTCHAADGNGIASLAPPLNKSEWVKGDKVKLISIVLHGLTGPVTVNGHVYEAPEIVADMPGIAHSDEISDEDIAQLLSFIRRSWQNDASKIETKDVVGVRAKLKDRKKAFTIEELTGSK